MTFAESVKRNLGRKYFFAFGGRASRSEYWWFILFIFLVNLATGVVGGQLLNINQTLAEVVFLLPPILLFSPNISLTVRRFHDTNRAGWWILAPIALLALFILNGGYAAQPNMLLNVLTLGACVCYLIVLCLPGIPGPNRFGNPEN